MNISPTGHLIQKVGGDADLMAKIMRAARDPQIRYESRRGNGESFRHIRDGIVAVVSTTGSVITFYVDQDETPLRPDQTDADAIRHAAKVARAARDAKKNARRAHDRALTMAQKGKKA
jgi:hypothetical protein